MRQRSDAIKIREVSPKNQSPAALLWMKRRWTVGFAACLMASVLLHPLNWMWPVSALVCLVIAIGAHERLRAIIGEPSRWRDVFDLEVPPAPWRSKTSSKVSAREPPLLSERR